MAGFTLKINENMVYGLFDPVERGLEQLANDVANTARTHAPVGKRTRKKTRELSLSFRKIENRPIGKSDYVRPEFNGAPFELEADVHKFIMSELKKHESGLYDVTAQVPSLNRKGKATDYPLMNARAVVELGKKKQVGRDVLDDRPIHERPTTPTKLVTGPRLKDSIFVQMDLEGPATWVATVIADRPYAYYVEKGLGPGVRMPTHFMERSLIEHAGRIESGQVVKR